MKNLENKLFDIVFDMRLLDIQIYGINRKLKLLFGAKDMGIMEYVIFEFDYVKDFHIKADIFNEEYNYVENSGKADGFIDNLELEQIDEQFYLITIGEWPTKIELVYKSLNYYQFKDDDIQKYWKVIDASEYERKEN